jgi:hypothetical protein
LARPIHYFASWASAFGPEEAIYPLIAGAIDSLATAFASIAIAINPSQLRLPGSPLRRVRCNRSLCRSQRICVVGNADRPAGRIFASIAAFFSREQRRLVCGQHFFVVRRCDECVATVFEPIAAHLRCGQRGSARGKDFCVRRSVFQSRATQTRWERGKNSFDGLDRSSFLRPEGDLPQRGESNDQR